MSAAADLMPRYDIGTDDGLRYGGGYWSMDRRRGGMLDFIDGRSGELLTVSDEELAGLICSSHARIVRAGATEKDEAYAAATFDLTVTPTADVDEARRQLAYVEELRRRGLDHRGPSGEVDAMIAEVAAKIADPQPPQRYLVKRWEKRSTARAAGAGRAKGDVTVGDLVPQHGFKGNRTSRVCFEVSKIIHARINKVYLTRECRSVDTLLADCRAEVRAQNEKRDPRDPLRVPGLKAVQNAIDSIDLHELLTMRHGADRAHAELGPVQYRARPAAPLDEVEIDHTTSDLFVVDDLTMAPLGRATIALGVDRCTGMPWGLHVGFDPPSVHTVMQCLRNGMFPKTYVGIYAEAGVWDIEHRWPVFGRPLQISVDRGAENINADVKALGIDLPVKRIEAKAGRKGRLKGHIERFLGTVNRTLLQEQRGTTFSNIVDRDDYDPRKNAVITYSELLEKLHAFLIDTYIRRKQGGIKDVPIRLWNEKILIYKPRQVENADSILPLFGRIEHRVLRRDGIRWKHLFFNSPELNALLSNNEFRKASTNARGDVVVRFRYDPSNIDHVHVYLPHARGQETMHLRVPIEKRSQEYARGLSVWAHDSIVKMIRVMVDAHVDQAALDAAKAKLIVDMDADMPGSAKVRGIQRIARIRQIGGVAPYGDCVQTTPAGSFEDRRQEAAIAAANAAGASRPETPQASNDGLPEPSEITPDEDEDFAEQQPSAPATASKARKPAYTRRSDPASTPAKRGRPAGKGRKATPRVSAAANEDEIDFYSEEMKA